MCQTPRAIETTPALENLFDPAARSVRAGASSPPGACLASRARARVIEHEFEDREGARMADMLPIHDDPLLEKQRALWERWKRSRGTGALAAAPIPPRLGPNGVRNAPESRPETEPWHYSGYGSAPGVGTDLLMVPIVPVVKS